MPVVASALTGEERGEEKVTPIVFFEEVSAPVLLHLSTCWNNVEVQTGLHS
jgi:hypothetical protein